MTPGLAVGLLASLASALALNWGFFAQHGAASALPPLSLRRPVRSLRLLFTSRRWLLGFTAGLGGWALYVGALALAPLSLVQATSAGGIGILALLVHFRGHDRLGRSEWVAVGVAILGLVLLGASLAGSVPPSGSARPSALAAWLLGSAAVAVVAAGPGSLVLSAGAGLGIAAGVLYAAGDVATKAAAEGLLVVIPLVLVAHGLAFTSLQLGFQRGRAMATAGLSTLFTNALPIAAGIVLFGERLPGGATSSVRVAAFALVTVGAALLARRSANEPQVNAAQAGTARPDTASSPRTRTNNASIASDALRLNSSSARQV
jgi:hypothetical protein